MKLGILLVTLIASAGCGKPRDLGQFEGVVLEYERQAVARGVYLDLDRLRVRMVDFVPHGDAAICETSSDPFADYSGDIQVRRSWWERKEVSDDARMWLIFHELGHCLSNLEHRNDGFQLMNAEANYENDANFVYEGQYHMGMKEWREHRAEILDRHFGSI